MKKLIEFIDGKSKVNQNRELSTKDLNSESELWKIEPIHESKNSETQNERQLNTILQVINFL